jgi:uncharacterized OsmC-like protein
VDASDGRLVGEAEGDVELDGGTLVIRRIRVRFRLRAPEEARETVERVHGVFAGRCPVYRSITPSIEITTSFELV